MLASVLHLTNTHIFLNDYLIITIINYYNERLCILVLHTRIDFVSICTHVIITNAYFYLF